MSEEIYCNECWQELQGKGVFIPCHHVFCEECAGRNLIVSGQCPFCSSSFETTKDMLEFQIVGSRVEESELRDLKAMLLAIGVANGAEYVESLGAQALTLEREQTRAKLQVQGRHMRSLQKALRTAESQREEEIRVAQQESDKLKSITAECKTKLAKAAAENDVLRAKVEDGLRQITNWKSMYESLRDGTQGGSDLGPGKRKQAGISSSSRFLSNSGNIIHGSGGSHRSSSQFGLGRQSPLRPSSAGGLSAGRPYSASSGRWPPFPSQQRPNQQGAASDAGLVNPNGLGGSGTPERINSSDGTRGEGAAAMRRSNGLFDPPPTRHGPRKVPKGSLDNRSSPPSRGYGSPTSSGRFGEVKATSSLSFRGVNRRL